jgi:DNA repair protein RadC
MTYQIVSERQKSNPKKLRNPEDAYNLVKRYSNARQEHFIVITLDGSHIPISVAIVSIGLVNRTIVHPREVFFRAIKDMASAVIVCHNHPSGSLDASPEDQLLTERLSNAGEIVGIQVIDHIIFSRFGYASLRQEGYFKDNDDE